MVTVDRAVRPETTYRANWDGDYLLS